ncbi:MAG: hypothetical protein HC933_05295 [Pleurocapsa sp. SU_196_0]|nr:hypothetical protein [Pleurocapsa sp. SU_196_0]
MPEPRPEIRAAREPLTLTEFKRALEQGLGRAILCLQKHDPAPYRNIILEACLKDTRFDSQCEDSRVPYLLEAMELVGNIEFFEERILQAHPKTPTTTPDFHEHRWLEQQFSAFALAFAKRGNATARQLLYDSFAMNPCYSDKFALERNDLIIELDGLEGLRFVLEQYARVARDDLEYWLDSGMLGDAVERLGAKVVQELIEELSRANADIKSIVERGKLLPIPGFRRSPTKYTPRPLAYAVFVQRVQRRSPFPGGIVSWSRFATKAALKQVARDLLEQTEPELIRGHLYAFRIRPFPLSARHLLKLARHENAEVREGALVAMQAIKHPAIRALALELKHDPTMRIEAVAMLESNYELGDAAIVLETIHSLSDAEFIHWFGYRVRDIYRKNRVPEALEPLLALYESNPCSSCRESFVMLMQEIGVLPNWVLEEAAWDSAEDTRTQARAWAIAA